MTVTSKPLYGEEIGFVRDGRVYFSDRFMLFIDQLVNDSGKLIWPNLDTSGSSLLDLETRQHDDLQDIGEADDSSSDTEKTKHVSNAQAKAWTDGGTAAATHIAATSAHGANGALVGKGDAAAAGSRGVVFQALAVTDAASSTVSVDSADISAAPASYDQTWAESVETLANEVKADINQLTSDLNTAVGQVNSLLAELRDAGIIAP